MSDAFNLEGSWETQPQNGNPSAEPTLIAPIQETFNLARKNYAEVDLDADAEVLVPFGSVTSANALIVKSVGGKVRARVTSADGILQAFPVDSLLLLLAESVGITAVGLTRVTGTATTCRVFLGQKA